MQAGLASFPGEHAHRRNRNELEGSRPKPRSQRDLDEHLFEALQQDPGVGR